MANNPELLKMPLARDGQKSTIPETTDASTGLFSQQYGWQSINSLPPQAGGKAVKREDFNGAFNLLGGIAFMAQKGFTFNFDATQDYYAGCMVIDTTDGQKYECIADVTAGGSAPSADSTHWQLAGNNSVDIDTWFRQASTAYANGAIALLLTLPTGWYLECTGTGGITSADDLVITSPSVGDTVTDGAVVWTIRAVASTADIPAPVDISGKADITGANMVYHKDVITTSGTYTAPATGLYKITVKGGGGGGGFGQAGNTYGGYSGGGGGEGGTTITYALLTANESVSVIVGAGGAGATANAVTASSGGDSSVTINGDTFVGGGGGGGVNHDSTATVGNISAGIGGTGTIPGAPGSGEGQTSGLTVSGGSGGGAGGGISKVGIPDAAIQGGGGAGATGLNGKGSFAGGAGGDGYVWFEYYTP